MDRVDIIGVNISATNINECLNDIQDNFENIKGKYICAANVHTTVIAHENINYCKVQNNSYMTLPDGKPLSIVGKNKGFTNMGRVSGPEFMEKIISLSEMNGWTHYFYGNTSENLNTLIKYLKKEYPKLLIKGYEPSLFRSLTNEEESELINRINDLMPDFVWVGLGAPLQEKFCANFSCKTKSVWVGVGGAFNVMAGIIPRAPMWMQKYCLEWFYRLMKEPTRLFKRYFVMNIKFIFYLCKTSKR